MIPMPQISLVTGALLILNGIIGFVMTGSEHFTALIPAGFGLLFVISGWIALNPLYLKHSMHATVLLALFGLFGSMGGLMKLPALIAGQSVARPPAVISQSFMALLCLLFIILAVGSFIQARRLRSATGQNISS